VYRIFIQLGTWLFNYTLFFAKAAFNKTTLFISKLDVNLKNKLVECYIWSTAV